MGILGSFKVFFRGKKKALFCIIAFLSFKDMGIFLKRFFNVRVVLNCWDLKFFIYIFYLNQTFMY